MGILAALFTTPAHSRTIRVALDGGGDFASIQAAIASSFHGDSIEVAPGTYHEHLRFFGRAITVRSTSGPEVTIIDGDDLASVVVMDLLEGPNTVLDGFTLCHGLGTPIRSGGRSPLDAGVQRRDELSGDGALRSRLGGGIFLLTAAPTLRNLIVRDNRADLGGGLYALQTDPHLEHCRFLKNTAGLGAGVFLEMTEEAVFLDCEFRSNLGVTGGGIALLQGSARIEGCRFAANQASEGTGLELLDCTEATVVRTSIFDHNQGVDGSVALVLGSRLDLQSCTAAANGFPGERAAAVVYRNGSSGAIDHSILAVWEGDRPLSVQGSEVQVHCSNLWAESDPLSAPSGDNLAAPPGFCDEEGGDLRLREGSPCLPPQSPPGCGLIGALGQGCAGTSGGGTLVR
jgi:hypothetical protein